MTKRDLLNTIDFDSLIKLNYDIKIIRDNKYFTKKDFVDALARNLSRNECEQLTKLYKVDFSIDEISKNFLTMHRPTGNFLKNKFIEYLITSEIKGKLHNDVIFVEFPVDEKRTDITRINGYSFAYEIKSNRDDVSRSKGQTNEFLLVFDYVYLIVENINQDFDLDKKVGIYHAIKDKETIDFKCIKKPIRSNNYDSEKQLSLLQKNELIKINRKYGFLHNGSRNEMEKSILKNFDEETINRLFRYYIKNRYKQVWLKNLKYFLS